MINFLTAYPEFITWLFSGVGCIIGVLLSIIGLLVKMSIDRLNQTITSLTTKQESIESSVDALDLRLTTQETICDTCRRSCPQRQNG